ncbi:MAG: RNA pseudouridine synthase, partial [Acidobacteria bacterium]|nr:RNA pseudouridine synthase [Acidobacteriota bacterium]NIQ84880.1 RNA pseudouridine synthase [Acidobacteriota bacterium]
PTLPGGGFLEHTLLYELRRYREDLRPLHRLGRHTSGIVLCATHGP